MREILKDAIEKAAEVQSLEISEEELAKINQYALEPLKADEVYAFKVYACDNETDDRNNAPFNLAALNDMKALYVGKTMIKDHARRADNQVARVYDSYTEASTEITGGGEVMTKLVLKCYMVRTASNADLIKEVQAGIKKEVSTSCLPKRYVCSVCGKDNMETACPHWPGVNYNDKMCYFTIDGVSDVYELSFVATPAQPRAGTCKEATTENADEESANIVNENETELTTRVKAASFFIFTENERKKTND